MGSVASRPKSDAHNLHERLKAYESAVLLFVDDLHVSFINNRAEHDLRMAKVKQRVSGCFRVEVYVHIYCRISSYLQTIASKGYNPLLAIQRAMAGEFDSVGGESYKKERGRYSGYHRYSLVETANFG